MLPPFGNLFGSIKFLSSNSLGFLTGIPVKIDRHSTALGPDMRIIPIPDGTLPDEKAKIVVLFSILPKKNPHLIWKVYTIYKK